MKTQMRFQKLLFKIALIVSALAIFYALAFCTGAIAYMGHWVKSSASYVGISTTDFDAMTDTYNNAQTYTNILLALGIVYIAIVIVCYIFANSGRRNYYKANYITSIILAAYAVVWAVIAIILSVQTQIGILGNEGWNVGCKEFSGSDDSYIYSNSTWIYIVGYIISLCSIAVAAGVAYNCIWKMKLMKGEKALLANGAQMVQEVA